MQVSIPAEMELFVRGVVERGGYQTPADVVGEALRLLERREQFVRDVREGVEQLDRGEYSDYGDGDLDVFLKDVKAEENKMFSHAEGRK
jgi:putative addiction module CopG family antidote